MTAPTGDVPSLQLVVMGVSGSGKSTVAGALASRWGWELVEGDDLHPPANVAKMAAGRPLTDEDRWPWLDLVRDRARAQAAAGHSSVITCSALRRRYRDRLAAGVPSMHFLHLATPQDLLEQRMARREGHFMPAALLRSQLDTLEPLAADEDGTVIDAGRPLPEVVRQAEAAVQAALEARLRG